MDRIKTLLLAALVATALALGPLVIGADRVFAGPPDDRGPPGSSAEEVYCNSPAGSIPNPVTVQHC